MSAYTDVIDASLLERARTDEQSEQQELIRDGRRALSTLAGETLVTDPVTGGKKGQKLQRYDLIPPEFEKALAEVYGRGSLKYEDRNWEKGYAWSLSVGALRRHLNAWQMGERHDPETSAYHLVQVAWHAAALFTFELRGLGTDDVRPSHDTRLPDTHPLMVGLPE